ncbi:MULTISPECIES: RHS repeat domain-containing protein [Photorhabdus]|uniref:RHS repeat domain-containing protein n=1 Tax=Photorhabdus TaxID=29487 RepID=UPI0006997E6E|nr:RHS repeat-associated core domain-containing protein [Photorhabdus thracensis]
MSNFFSQAQNFFSAQQSGIDPRTGTFSFLLPIANIDANVGLGPTANVSLNYNMFKTGNIGFGIGFDFSFTTYDAKNKLLTLSSGERYKVYDTPEYVKVRQKKLNNFKFERSGDHYKITYKSGVVEFLDGPSSGHDIKNITKILSPLGHSLNFKWIFKGFMRLSEITGVHGVLLRADYNDTSIPKITVFPGTGDEYNLKFTLFNDYLKKVTLMEMGYSWSIDYNGMNFISKITHPTFLIESIDYQQEVIHFPEDVLPALPAAIRHSISPGADQPTMTALYNYTSNNYLGFGSGLNFKNDEDNLYDVLSDYTYGSTEIRKSGNVTVTTSRKYNNFHLLKEETVVREKNASPSWKYKVTTASSYYAVPGIAFDKQPPQFQLLKEKITTWDDGKGQTRQETVTAEYDKSGNPIRQTDQDGTVTEFTWYSAQGEKGCPKEPHGFVRFLKQKKVMPPSSSYGDDPVYTTLYAYEKLESTAYIVQKTSSDYGDNTLLQQRTIAYQANNSSEFGRITVITDTKYENGVGSSSYTSKQEFSSVVSGGVLKQSVKFIGHDSVNTVSSQEQSVFSGLLLNQTDTQNVTVVYTYDKAGHLVTRIVADGTKYKNTTTWKYAIEDNGPVTIEIDAAGNQLRTRFDGIGRVIRQQRYDVDVSKQWYNVFSCKFNELGENITGTSLDWLTSAQGKGDRFSVQTDLKYGGWGEVKVQAFSDGTKSLQDMDPVKLTQAVYSKGVFKSATLTSGKYITTFDKRSSLPLTYTQLDTSGIAQGVRKYDWDGLGRLRRETDELNNATQRIYDVYGRVLTQTLPDGSKVSRAYAPHLTGEQVASISVTGLGADNISKTWLLGTQEFDSLGRVTKRTCGRRTTLYTYEGASPVPLVVTLLSGKTVKYTSIPELGNMISGITAEGVTQTFSYDNKTSDLLEAKEGSTENSNTWNPSGSLKAEIFTQNGSTRSMVYTRTLVGKLVTYTDITGKQTRYNCDAYGRVTSIADPALTATLTYDALGRLGTQTVKDTATASTLTTELGYDDFGREIRRTITDSSGTTLVITQTWQKNGLLATSTTEKNGSTERSEQYGYDNRNRLISYAAGGSLPLDAYGKRMSGQQYRYDALNNLILVITKLANGTEDKATYHYKNNDDPTQLTSVTHTHAGYPKSISLKYDVEGRMVRDEAGKTLTYDVLGRLTNISGKNNVDGTYGYDALNRLVTQKASKGDMRMLYYRGEELVNEVITSQERENRLIKMGHSCLGVNSGTQLTLTAGDRHGSLLWSRDSTGSKDGTLHAWSPYGSGDSSKELLGFNGERVDPVSGTYHLGNGYRAYNPALMRFNCPDSLSPFGAGGINPYAYCAGDPVNHIDPSGHLSWQAITGIVAGTIGLALAVFTAGASIAAAGGVMSAISSASTIALISGSIGVVSDVTAIASGALEDISPETSVILGWVSLGTGVLGLGASGATALMRKGGASSVSNVAHSPAYSKGLAGQKIERNITLGQDIRNFNLAVEHNESALLIFEDTYRGENRLNLIAHGTTYSDSSVMVIKGEYVSAESFVKKGFLAKYDMNNYPYIRTLVCHSAEGGSNSFAGQLANITGKGVKGFIGEVKVSHNPENFTQSLTRLRSKGIQESKAKVYEIAQNTEFKLTSSKENARRFNYKP